MIDRLKKNYKLTMTLASILFAISVAFCGFFTVEAFLGKLVVANIIVLPKNFFLTAALSCLCGGAAVGVLWLVIKLFFRFAKIYNLPQNEIFLFFMIVLILRNIVLGGFNVLFRFMPITYAWGHLIAYTVITFICAFGLFKIIDKLYLTAKAAPFLFKSYWIFILICVAAGVLVRLNGGIL